jgi:hypothetical protein
LSGEGIATALRTGRLAAEALARDAAPNYWRAIHAQYRRYYKVRPLLDALGDSPTFTMNRGVDIFTSPQRFAGQALRRIIWDLDGRPRRGKRSQAGIAARRTTAVADHIVKGVAGIAPGAAVLLRELIEDINGTFGTAVSFTDALATEAAHDASAVSVGVLAVLEAGPILEYLHEDLSASGNHTGKGNASSYGCDTLTLLAADALTAFVMTEVARLDTATAKRLLAIVRRDCQRIAARRDDVLDRRPYLDPRSDWHELTDLYRHLAERRHLQAQPDRARNTAVGAA